MTIQKPQPKELVVQNVDGMLFIYVSSEDAARWVEREAPAFGSLIPPDEHHRFYMLFVSPTFRHGEVVAYLESYGSQEE